MATNMTELRVQAGKQVSWATGVTPTVMLRGITEFKVKPEQEIQELNDLNLNFAGADNQELISNGGGGSFSGWASYEDLPYWLDSLFSDATPGAGPGYSRAYAAPVATAPSPRIMSLVYGDGTVGAYQLVGGVLSEMTLRLEPKKEITVSGTLIGSSIAADALESLTTRTVTPIMAGDVTGLALDAWAGTMGATALDDCYLRSMELSIRTNRTLRYCVGSLSASDYIHKPWESTLKIKLEWNATSKAIIDAMVGGATTQRQFEAEFSGGTNKTLQIQYAGTIAEPPEIFEDDDGVVTTTLTLRRTYHSTFANWCKMAVANAVATLP